MQEVAIAILAAMLAKGRWQDACESKQRARKSQEMR